MSRRIAIFPLSGTVLFPRMHLPLHIFEPRYRAMIQEVMARDQRIGMIQPSGLPGLESVRWWCPPDRIQGLRPG